MIVSRVVFILVAVRRGIFVSSDLNVRLANVALRWCDLTASYRRKRGCRRSFNGLVRHLHRLFGMGDA